MNQAASPLGNVAPISCSTGGERPRRRSWIAPLPVVRKLREFVAVPSEIPSLDASLQRGARRNQVSGAARIFVVPERGRVVACASFAPESLPPPLHPVLSAHHAGPSYRACTTAVHRACQKRGLGQRHSGMPPCGPPRRPRSLALCSLWAHAFRMPNASIWRLTWRITPSRPWR